MSGDLATGGRGYGAMSTLGVSSTGKKSHETTSESPALNPEADHPFECKPLGAHPTQPPNNSRVCQASLDPPRSAGKGSPATLRGLARLAEDGTYPDWL